ncbi:MAG: ATP-binding protein [Spirochaetaceae bacterium]|jgi:predicted AAA+ superfamily ATPase|nr:ATP-binding protein [Spirochaetaceae bacterium]
MRRKFETLLLEWKSKKTGRKPLVLFGARQVGKTFVLNEFGAKHFKNTVYINFETNPRVAEFFEGDLETARIIRFLETVAASKIIPEDTLVIFDEIQTCERALTALKYFCESAAEYHIAAAGSLLGLAINREQYSFPVGKIESKTLYPMDFEEFLWALGEELLLDEIHRCFSTFSPMPAALHDRAIELYRCYLIVGGMPACVDSFVKYNKLVLIPTIQNEIVNNYVADMAKYAGKNDTVKIRACFNSLPAQLAKENKKFQYKVVQRGGSAALFGTSIDWLIQSGIVLQCSRLEQAVNPIAVYTDLASFKLYMSDVGLLCMKSGIAQQTVLTGDSNQFMGALTENYIAQALSANNYPLYYWTSEHIAELDFVLQNGTDIIGIEVKKGIKTHSKSLNQFIQKYHPAYSLRFSEKNFGQAENILSIPHYAAFCLNSFFK